MRYFFNGIFRGLTLLCLTATTHGQSVGAPTDTMSTAAPAPHRTSWTVQCRPLGKKLYQFDKGHMFNVSVHVYQPDGIPARGLPEECFNFAIDGYFGRQALTTGEWCRVTPDYHGLPLEVDVLIEGGPATRLMAMKNSNGPAGDIQTWMSGFLPALPKQTLMNIWVADGGDIQAGGRQLQAGAAVLAALDRIGKRDDFSPADNLATALEKMERDYVFAEAPFSGKLRPQCHLIFSAREGFTRATGLQKVAATLGARHQPGLLVMVGSSLEATSGVTAGRDADQAPACARAMTTQTAPFYALQTRLSKGRLEADRRDHAFVVKVKHGPDWVISNSLGFSLWSSTMPLWQKIMIVAGGVVLILLIAISITLITYSVRTISERRRMV